MAITVYEGAKFYFDILFSIPDPFNHTDFCIEDTIPEGYSIVTLTPATPSDPVVPNVTINEVEVDDTGKVVLDADGAMVFVTGITDFKAIINPNVKPGQDTLNVSEITPLTAGKTYLLTVPVVVNNGNLAAKATKNIASFYVDKNDDASEDGIADFIATKATLSFWGSSSILDTTDGATSTLMYEVSVLNDHSEQEYKVTIDLDGVLQEADFPFVFSKHLIDSTTGNAVYVTAYRKGPNGDALPLTRQSDFEVTSPATDEMLKKVTVHATDNTRGHRIYLVFGIKYQADPADLPIRSQYDVHATLEFEPQDVQNKQSVHVVEMEEILSFKPTKSLR